jgi:NitT/TauT family transport system permease protein
MWPFNAAFHFCCNFFTIRAEPGKSTGIILMIMPFIAAGYFYSNLSETKYAENPKQKSVPSFEQIYEKGVSILTPPDNSDLPEGKRPKKWQIAEDLKATGYRFVVGMVISVFTAIFLGLHMGAMPYIEKLFRLFLVVIDKINPILLLAITFSILKGGEVFKIAMVVIGTFPSICIDAYERAKGIHNEYKIAGFSLGATDLEVTYTIIFPQIWPHLLTIIRINLKAGFFFLVAAEFNKAKAGIGYTVIKAMRYMNTDIIVNYVIIATILMVIIDTAILLYQTYGFDWQED